MSVFSKVLEGPYNDNLSWPFLGTLTIHLLNQLEEDNHHNLKVTVNSTCNAQVGSIWDYGVFFPHSKFSHDQASNPIPHGEHSASE